MEKITGCQFYDCCITKHYYFHFPVLSLFAFALMKWVVILDMKQTVTSSNQQDLSLMKTSKTSVWWKLNDWKFCINSEKHIPHEFLCMMADFISNLAAQEKTQICDLKKFQIFLWWCVWGGYHYVGRLSKTDFIP